MSFFHSVRRAAAAPLLRLSAPTRSFTSSSSSSSPLLNEAAVAATPSSSSPLPPSSSSSSSSRPVSTRVYSSSTLRRQALAQTQPFYISANQFRVLKHGGFGKSVNTKLPFELRQHKPLYEMLKLRKQEAMRLTSDPARVIADFAAGDKICVTKYLSLNDRTKFERLSGLVLARYKGDRLSASFLMRCHKLGEDYELNFPLHSPFIARIDVLEKSTYNHRQKMYYLRERERTGWEVKTPVMAKPHVAPVSVDRVAKESGGAVKVLDFQPMKKIIKEKKAGGVAAELAAAGGDKKGAAKPAPKKK